MTLIDPATACLLLLLLAWATACLLLPEATGAITCVPTCRCCYLLLPACVQEPLVDVVEPEQICTNGCAIKQINIMTMKKEDATFKWVHTKSHHITS